MYLDQSHPQSSLKKAVKAPLEVRAFRLQGQWPELPDALRAFQNLEVLQLKGVGLKRFPAWIGELTALKAIDVSNNPLEEFPNLPRLEELEMAYLGTELPRGLQRLTGLRRLSLHHGDLEKLPELPFRLEVLQLNSLKLAYLPFLPDTLQVLELKDNPLVALPPLPQLRELRLGGNSLNFVGLLPASIQRLDLERLGLRRLDLGDLPELEWLDVSFNEVELPEDLGRYGRLNTLFAVQCGLTRVPESLLELSKLEFLNLNVNQLREVPDLSRLPKLAMLYLKGNLLSRLPDLSALPLREVMLGGNPLQAPPRVPPECSVDLEDAGVLLSQPDLTRWVAEAVGLPPAPLVPLRVPAGWMVLANDFREENQHARDGLLLSLQYGARRVLLETAEGAYRLEGQGFADWQSAAAAVEKCLEQS